jgi:hypothetical protein
MSADADADADADGEGEGWGEGSPGRSDWFSTTIQHRHKSITFLSEG